MDKDAKCYTTMNANKRLKGNWPYYEYKTDMLK